MSYQTLLTNLENGIFTVIINRPEKLNALNKDVFKDLEKVLQEITENPEIKSVIITGSGNKAFVAGADIIEFAGLSIKEGQNLARNGQKIFFKTLNPALNHKVSST